MVSGRQALELAKAISQSANEINLPPDEGLPSHNQSVIPFSLVRSTRGYLERVVHQVNVSGADIDPPGANGNFSLVAKEFDDGTVRGQYQDTFGLPFQPGVHADVTCVSVSGNQAWVSGVITHAPRGFEFLIGSGVGTRFEDNGNNSNDPPDRLSFSVIGVDPDICSLQLGDSFFPLFDASHGQIQGD